MQDNNQTYNEVLNLCENNYSHDEMIKFLRQGSVVERQYAALNLKCLLSENDAKLLISNLVGVDGKIREAVSLKIAEFTEKYPNLFDDKFIFDMLAKATIDIDGNVCRLAINSAVNLISNKKFAEYYSNEMIRIVKNALEEISKFTFRDKKYKINKQVFKIYWCLEALISFHSYANLNDLKQILTECSKLTEYTIREKCAKILSCMILDDELQAIKQNLMSDENYYVRNIFK